MPPGPWGFLSHYRIIIFNNQIYQRIMICWIQKYLPNGWNILCEGAALPPWAGVWGRLHGHWKYSWENRRGHVQAADQSLPKVSSINLKAKFYLLVSCPSFPILHFPAASSSQSAKSSYSLLPTFLILLFPTALSSRLTKCARASSASMTWWATSASMSHRFQPILCSMSFSLFSETIKQSIHKNSTLLDLVI